MTKIEKAPDTQICASITDTIYGADTNPGWQLKETVSALKEDVWL